MRLVIFCGSEKAAHHTSSVGRWLLKAAFVGDVLPHAQVRHTARWFEGLGYCMKNRLFDVIAVGFASLLGAQTVAAAPAAPLTQVKVLKVESPGCGFEDIAPQQEKTRCDHAGPNIKVYVLEVGYGRSAQVGLDGFQVNGTRTPVCAFNNGNLTECSVGRKTVGYVYVFDLAGKQEGTFTFSNTSINAPGNTLATRLYIK